MRTWSRPLIALIAGAAVAACAKGTEQADNDGAVGDPPDASIVITPDGAPGTPDASPGTPDGSPGSPDAAPGTADAAPGTPDATPPPPDATPIPDATPPPPDAGCTDVIVQLLSNENFDLGPGGGWVEQSMFALITDSGTLPVAPQSGNYGVWMGGAYDASDIFYQDVVIPAGATNMSVAGYRWIGTEETSGTWDFLYVTLRNTSNTVLETLATWSNANESTGWVAFNLIPVGNYAGQTVRLYLQSQTDSTLNTNFFFDTFALRVTVCQ